PNSENPSITSPYPDGPPTGNDGDTFLVYSCTPASSACGPASAAAFYRNVTLNGASNQVSDRSNVLVFDGTTWNTPQRVYVFAVDDARAEGTRIVAASHSVIQENCNPTDLKNCYDDAIVRNVEVTVYDNDQPDVIIAQLDPDTSHIDNNTAVLEGWGTDT